jgi:hypothetical protein
MENLYQASYSQGYQDFREAREPRPQDAPDPGGYGDGWDDATAVAADNPSAEVELARLEALIDKCQNHGEAV